MTAKKMSPQLHEEGFGLMAALEGFDIQGFDQWLAGLDDCGAKRELTERRQWAKEAIQIGAVNRDALLRHLEWMLLRWKYIRRTDYLVPLARTGDKVRKPFNKANMDRVNGAEAERQELQNRAAAKWAEPQHAKKSAAEIARLIAQPGENPDTIRRRIKKLS